jgi:hypothetical protein
MLLQAGQLRVAQLNAVDQMLLAVKAPVHEEVKTAVVHECLGHKVGAFRPQATSLVQHGLASAFGVIALATNVHISMARFKDLFYGIAFKVGFVVHRSYGASLFNYDIILRGIGHIGN